MEAAMHLFWQHGFQSTSLDQLRTAMGISVASFYAAFGSKEALFRMTVERYLASHGTVTSPLHDATLAPREAVRTTLRRSARMQTEKTHPLGCMIVMSAANHSADNAHLGALLATERARTRDAIQAAVKRAVVTGELRDDTDVAGLATAFDGFLAGMSIQARDGVKSGRLNRAIDRLMSLWDAQKVS